METLGEKQKQFADIIWAEQPIGSRALTEICQEKLGWKRTTTYTMLKGLCEKGIFENQNGIVVALMSKAEFGAAQGKDLLHESFGGSLPTFLAAFTRKNKLSKADIAALEELIANHKEDE